MAAQAGKDDLAELAAQAGTAQAQKGLPVDGVFLESGSGRVDDPGFETRVKAPAAKKSPAKEKGGIPLLGGRSKMPRGSQPEKVAADIAETLEEKAALIFGTLSGVLPVTSVYGTENSPKAVRALLDIGKRRPMVMRALIKIADGADGLEVGKFAAGVAMAIQVDLGRVDGNSLPARTFGVTEILEKYFVEQGVDPENPSVMKQDVADAPRFSTIS